MGENEAFCNGKVFLEAPDLQDDFVTLTVAVGCLLWVEDVVG